MSADTLTLRQRQRLIATAFLSLFAIVGLVLYGLPLYYDFFVRELGWTRARVTSGNMIGKILIGPLFGFVAGWMIDRYGPRKPMILGILLATTALFGLGGVTEVSWFYVFYALNALGYVLAGPLPNQVLLSRHFKETRGRAMGIAYLGIGLGFFVVPLISRALIASLGWHTALRCLGVLVVLVALPLVLMLREGEGPAQHPSSAAPRVSLKGPLSSRNFYLLALGSMASIGAVGGANQHLKLLLSLDQGRSQADALTIVSMIAGVSLVGRLGAGALADRMGAKRVMLLVYLLVTTAMLLLTAGATGNNIYLFVVVFGLGLGGEYLIIPLMAAELFGTAVLGRVMGIILTADGVAEALFPWVVGRLHDSTGSYRRGFELLAVLAALGAVAVALLPRSRSRVDVTAAPAPAK
jgi:nitrate/nitrite transporter NarK